MCCQQQFVPDYNVAHGAARMALLSGTKLGHYEIQSTLGVGGMGEVYRARDTRLQRAVAVKILPAHLADNPAARQRFEQEARTISSLNHPNICTLYDVGRQNGTDFLVMEYLEGETLADRLRQGPLPLEAILKYGVEICAGLERAHRSGVIHRDLKPGNIMLTKTGAKVMDFGLAKSIAPALVSTAGAVDTATTPTISLNSLNTSAMSQAGTIAGTFQYLAPEVLRGAAADVRSDIFSLGCVLYEMATGHPAFQGKSQISVLASILESEPAPIGETRPSSPPALEFVIRACLAKDPEERVQSAHDIKLQLKLLADTAAANAKGPAKGRIAGYPALAPAVLAGLLIGAAAIWLVRPQSRMAEMPVTELAVSLPGEMSLSPLSAPIISPDGNTVVFVAKTPDTVDAIYLRRLDNPMIRRLEGTEMAKNPFWSPDSASVAFFAGAQLKKVELSTGVLQGIAEASDGRGGAWSKDGVIIFSPDSHSPLFRVDASGGTPRPLTGLNGHESHRWPSFLPGDRRFIYTAQRGTEPGGIFLASLDDPSGRLLTAEVINGQIADGQLLFARGTTIVAANLDVSTGKLGGEKAVVAERVRTLPDRSLAEFSVAENGALIFVQGDADIFQLGWFDRTGKLLERISARDVGGELDLSPAGDRLLLDYKPAGGKQSVEIIDLQRGTANPVEKGSRLESPLWFPGGDSVIVGRNDIVRKWVDGSEREQILVKSSVRLFPDDCSKDGRWLLFESVDKQTNFDLMRLDMNAKTGPEPYLKTAANEAHGRISPDGHWVAYASDESGQTEVYVQSFPQTGGGKWRISTRGGDQPFWRGDGGELYYLAPDLALMAVPISHQKNFGPGVPVKLFQTTSMTWGITGNRNSFVATPDGKRFMFQYIPEQSGEKTIGIVQNWEGRVKGTGPAQSR